MIRSLERLCELGPHLDDDVETRLDEALGEGRRRPLRVRGHDECPLGRERSEVMGGEIDVGEGGDLGGPEHEAARLERTLRKRSGCLVGLVEHVQGERLKRSQLPKVRSAREERGEEDELGDIGLDTGRDRPQQGTGA